jgi:plastocyanin
MIERTMQKIVVTDMTLIFSLLFLTLLLVFSFSSFFADAQEETITIVPGSSDSSRYRFFDITEYPLNTGEEVKWYNADNIVHNIIVTSNDGDIIVAQSGNIKPKNSFSYKFDKPGEYFFKSANYNWMKGKVIVTNNIKTVKKNMNNDIEAYLSWIPPSHTQINKNTIFKIIFVDKKSEKNQEHIDYSFIIRNSSSDKILYQNTLTHSAWGVEPASYKLDPNYSFIGKLGIDGIQFQPIKPVYAEFEIQLK